MRPDEKSVMAYVAFFWKEFAANKRKNLAAERIGTVVAREQSFLQLQEQYTAQATELSQWLQEREVFFKKEAEETQRKLHDAVAALMPMAGGAEDGQVWHEGHAAAATFEDFLVQQKGFLDKELSALGPLADCLDEAPN